MTDLYLKFNCPMCGKIIDRGYFSTNVPDKNIWYSCYCMNFQISFNHITHELNTLNVWHYVDDRYNMAWRWDDYLESSITTLNILYQGNQLPIDLTNIKESSRESLNKFLKLKAFI